MVRRTRRKPETGTKWSIAGRSAFRRSTRPKRTIVAGSIRASENRPPSGLARRPRPSGIARRAADSGFDDRRHRQPPSRGGRLSPARSEPLRIARLPAPRCASAQATPASEHQMKRDHIIVGDLNLASRRRNTHGLSEVRDPEPIDLNSCEQQAAVCDELTERWAGAAAFLDADCTEYPCVVTAKLTTGDTYCCPKLVERMTKPVGPPPPSLRSLRYLAPLREMRASCPLSPFAPPLPIRARPAATTPRPDRNQGPSASPPPPSPRRRRRRRLLRPGSHPPPARCHEASAGRCQPARRRLRQLNPRRPGEQGLAQRDGRRGGWTTLAHVTTHRSRTARAQVGKPCRTSTVCSGSPPRST
jgi:hypothetical protein